jgi:hypothetical protein
MYKYKYKYKYDFTDPRNFPYKSTFMDHDSFTSQKPEPEGTANRNYLFSNFARDERGQDYITLYPGQYISNLGAWKGKIISVYVGLNNQVTLYQKNNFEGIKHVLTHGKGGGNYDLRGIKVCLEWRCAHAIGEACQEWVCKKKESWSDLVSSIVVEPVPRG